MTTIYTPLEPDSARRLIGEGLHTALRKGCSNGSDAWLAISAMPNADWSAALRFVIAGLDQMGYQLCAKSEAEGCEAVCYAGPGHQSKFRCQLPAGHDPEEKPHQYSQVRFEWTEDGECVDECHDRELSRRINDEADPD